MNLRPSGETRRHTRKEPSDGYVARTLPVDPSNRVGVLLSIPMTVSTVGEHCDLPELVAAVRDQQVRGRR